MGSEDTGYYGSHDVTPRERESWAAETEPQGELIACDVVIPPDVIEIFHELELERDGREL